MDYIYLLGNFVQLRDLNTLQRPGQLTPLHWGLQFLYPKTLKKTSKSKTERQTFCLITHILIQKFEGTPVTWCKSVSAVGTHIKPLHLPNTILKRKRGGKGVVGKRKGTVSISGLEERFSWLRNFRTGTLKRNRMIHLWLNIWCKVC